MRGAAKCLCFLCITFAILAVGFKISLHLKGIETAIFFNAHSTEKMANAVIEVNK